MGNGYGHIFLSIGNTSTGILMVVSPKGLHTGDVVVVEVVEDETTNVGTMITDARGEAPINVEDDSEEENGAHSKGNSEGSHP
ncbi:hypothetical protein GUJ93_ZPchr0001g33001 [Zizania palustris]|uniref:Uncharacterized protein n=1 Tax=Zizania palustris TaxID=103762 RepID=A0A8J5VSU6_ZIZPA|nr:hypothetical protein GUJ93_ZPchr0001g33001 [Zizania palustris]